MISDKILSLTKSIFSDKKYFDKEYINESCYLKMYRLHSRICGLLAKIGLKLDFNVDINRRYAIEPIKKTNGRFQRQAEADISYIDQNSDFPIVLIDYETSDAPIDKMRSKFDYLGSFRKENGSIQIISLFITITRVLHNWKKSDGTKETFEERFEFAQKKIIPLIGGIYDNTYNEDLLFLLGIFYEDYLELKLFKNKKIIKTEIVKY